ncbi:MAG TPA: ThiF family adenylyltransferase, partial [Nitrospira sp.]|nr:ThiF family adenylyltransferase [Nitrospira sp.]
MKGQAKISSRHLLSVEGLADASHARKLRIAIYVASEWSCTLAGQHLLVCLINLMCRQTDLVDHIDVVCDEHPLKVTCPGEFEQDMLLRSLRVLVEWAVGGEVTIGFPSKPGQVDMTIAIGCPDQFPVDLRSDTLFAVASGWLAWVGVGERAPRGIIPAKEDPMGPFLAASILAGEVFKQARRTTRGAPVQAAGYSLWTRAPSEAWLNLEDGPTLRGQMLPPLHVIGAGAVGHALIYTITAAALGASYLVLVDDDVYDETNLNRCLLAGKRDVSKAKVHTIERYVKRSGGDVAAFPCALQEYLVGPKTALRQDVADAVRNFQFDLVASCVDKNTSRQSIQGLWPALIVGGSTLGLKARSDIYSVKESTACLACHNPPEPDGEKIRALQARLRAMPAQERRHFLLEHALPADAIEAYLASPECGKVGEAEFKAFALQGAPQFSVGFVSMMAGIL